LTTFGLEPWQAKKLYGLWPDGADAQVRLDQTTLSARLGATVREFSTAPLALLSDGGAPKMRACKLLADNLKDASTHQHLMQGTSIPTGGFARRQLEAAQELTVEEAKAARLRATLWAIAESPADTLTSPERLLAQLGPALNEMPLEAGARVAHGLAWQYARKGQWAMARETFLLLAERYPTHPLTIDAYRWLMLHAASGEARRRHEMRKFLVIGRVDGGNEQTKTVDAPPKLADDKDKKKKQPTKPVEIPEITPVTHVEKHGLSSGEDVRRWF